MKETDNAGEKADNIKSFLSEAATLDFEKFGKTLDRSDKREDFLSSGLEK